LRAGVPIKELLQVVLSVYSSAEGGHSDGIEKLRGFSVNPLSGELTALPGSPFPLGTNVIPFDVAVTP
jgi:hypothetical protein